MNRSYFNGIFKNRNFVFIALFLLLIVAENFILFFYSVNLGQQWLNAGCYFISSLLIGFLIIGYFKNKTVEVHIEKRKIPTSLLLLSISAFAFIFFIIKDNQLFNTNAIDPLKSDIIPTVQVLVKRLLSGAFVYQPIEDFGYHLPVTYLPLQWIVYTPAEYWGFDYRWISFGIWCIACIWLMVSVSKAKNRYLSILVPALLYGIYFLILFKTESTISHTIETMVAGYYIILMITMNQRNAILQGIGITLCLLSRFSLVVWLPLWAFVMFVSNNRKKMFISMGTSALLVLIIYVIPFLSKDWSTFFTAYNYYSHAALGEWKSINYTIMKPYQLNTGVGIAFLYADHYANNLALGLKLLQRTGITCYLLTILFLGIWYWKNRKKIQYNIFLMASFKIYLSVFLFFIQVPYIYLMVVANFISIAIFAELLRYRVVDDKDKRTIS